MVLEEGVIEGRRTFGNIIKYIKMLPAAFRNMISVMVPVFSCRLRCCRSDTDANYCMTSHRWYPFDSVDREYIKKPRK
jgi:Mg2+-importing ATPase